MLKSTILIIVIVFALIFFIVSGLCLKGNLNSTTTLGKEIHSPSEALYNYNITKKAPFKYRLLFPTFIKSTYNIFSNFCDDKNDLFYKLYVFWSGFFFITAAVSFFYLLKVLDFNIAYSFLGTVLFLISPAIISGYALPVHTREDMLGYTILNIGLIFILKDKVFGILLICILGVLCRETLMILPLIYLLFSKSRLFYRIAVFALSFLTFFILRTGLGYESYNIFGLGLKYNLSSIWETIGFLFVVFSFLWIPFLLDIYRFCFLKDSVTQENLLFMRKSALFVVSLVLLTTFLGGRINEIRLLFIIFPWVISLFLFSVQSNFVEILRVLKSKRFKIYFFFCLLFFLIFSFFFYKTGTKIFIDNSSSVPYTQWIVFFCFYIFMFSLGLPFYFILLRQREK